MKPRAGGPRDRPTETFVEQRGAGGEAGGPSLLVREGGRDRSFSLGDAPLLIGRGAECAVRLASRFVAREHARIERTGPGAGHRIVDLAAPGGLLRDGRRLAARSAAPLADGDVLRIADPVTAGFITLVYRNPQVVAARSGATVARRVPLPESGKLVIGRSGAGLDLESPVVSRLHAAVERSGPGHFLRDLGSDNGTYLDGRRLTAPTLLERGAAIQIGPYRLVYDGAALLLYDLFGALRLDARELAQRAKGRFILRGASLSIEPRELVAFVGGSGAGKSTLMKALAGCAPPSHGQALLNGDDLYDRLGAYRMMLGYVPQEDTIHRELGVRRALRYAARLRLPPDTSGAEIGRRIERVLEDVDMLAHAHKSIDNLSGGQRKRVAIAAELLADPSLFFLDEPTSGLDPGLEKKMMLTLRRLADAGRTIVLVTHATANIAECDLVAFLAEGRLVFYGPPPEALRFFHVDDFADIYAKLDGSAHPGDAAAWAVVEADLPKEREAFEKARGGEVPLLAELWEMKFLGSSLHATYVTKRLGEAPPRPGWSSGVKRPRRARLSGLRQLFVLTRRYLDLLFQDKKNLALLLLQAPVIGYLTTLVARSDAIVGPKANSYDAKTVLFMLSTVGVWFGIINAAREIAKESAVLRRELLAGLGAIPYVLSKVIVLALLVAIQSGALLAVVGSVVRFPAQGVIFSGVEELFITTALTSMGGLSFGLAISAWAKTPDRAISLVPLALIPQILFSGVLFPFGTGVSATRALSWVTVSRWAMDAYGATINLNRILPVARPVPAEYAATRQNLIQCWEILGVYTGVCFVLACILVRLRDREG